MKPSLSVVQLLHLALLLLTLQLQPCVLVALSTPSSLAAGESLSPPNYITSPSGDFAFGFRALANTSDSFILAIWFRFDPGKVVWFAADDAGTGAAVVTTGQSSVLRLTITGQLSLANPANDNVWNPYTDASQNYGSILVLRDTGNLQFLGGADGETVVWESFRHPTDTLLPGQFMATGTSLRSRASDMDFLAGRFVFVVQWDGNLVLYRSDLPGFGTGSTTAYWSSGTCCFHNATLFFDASLVGYLYYQVTNNGTKSNLTTPHQTTDNMFFYQHATLDPDGILRVYILPNTTAGAGDGTGTASTWSVVNPVPSDGCQRTTVAGHGMCGPNSYCVYAGAGNRLDCQCPSGYTFLHTEFRYKGCVPAFLQDTCDNNDWKSHSSEFKFMEMPPDTYWAKPIFYDNYHQSITAEQCQDLCLHNCLCAAAVFDGSSNSCVEAAMLTIGWQDNSTSMKTLVKVRAKRPPINILPYAAIGVLAMLLLATVCMFLVHCYITHKKARNRKHLSAMVFTRKELRRATNGFSKLLGQGGFGKVYHGILKSVQPHDVAVKELRSTDDEYQEMEFENEVQSIGRIHHKNLVRMVGYCKEGVHRMLVFEFMPGGSLGDVLFKPSGERPPWSWRAEAAIAIARGLEYLHYGCRSQIVHCDIKPDNILLDERRTPKITDFGIARLLDGDKLKQTITHVRGTLGYLAPEWFSSSERKVDSKVDVFSFGVVLLEMICCRKYPPAPAPAPAPADGGQDVPRRGVDDDDGGDDSSEDTGVPVTLRAWVSDMVREGDVERAVQGDKEALLDLERVERFARIAIWCVQGDPSMRPTMRSVVWMMEGTMEVGALPADDPPAPRVHDFPAAAATHDNSSSIYDYY